MTASVSASHLAAAPRTPPAFRADRNLDFASLVTRTDQDSAPRHTAAGRTAPSQDDDQTTDALRRSDTARRDDQRSATRRSADRDRSEANAVSTPRFSADPNQANRPDDQDEPTDHDVSNASGSVQAGSPQESKAARATDEEPAPHRGSGRKSKGSDDQTLGGEAATTLGAAGTPVADAAMVAAAPPTVADPIAGAPVTSEGTTTFSAAATPSPAAGGTGAAAVVAEGTTPPQGPPGLGLEVAAAEGAGPADAADDVSPDAGQAEQSAGPDPKASAFAALLEAEGPVLSGLATSGASPARVAAATGSGFQIGTGKPASATGAQQAGTQRTGTVTIGAAPADASKPVEAGGTANPKADASPVAALPADAPPADPTTAQPSGNTATAPAVQQTPTPVLSAVAPQTSASQSPASPAQTAQTPASVPMHQVASVIASHARSGESRFQVRLHPEDLGRIDVSMTIDATGSAVAHLRVERPETLDLLRRDQRSLEQALGQAGFKTDSATLQFSLGDNGRQDPAFGQNSSQNSSQAWSDARENRGQTRFAVSAPSDNAVASQRAATTLPYSARTLRLGGVDISA